MTSSTFSALYSLLAFIGFTLTIVRLKVLAQPHASLACHLRWWAWVGVHCFFAIGFLTLSVQVFERDVPAPHPAEWFIHVALVAYLVLKIQHRPLASSTKDPR